MPPWWYEIVSETITHGALSCILQVVNEFVSTVERDRAGTKTNILDWTGKAT